MTTRATTKATRRHANLYGWVRRRFPSKQKIQRLIEIGDHLAGMAQSYEDITDDDYMAGKIDKKDLQGEAAVVTEMRQMAVDVWRLCAEMEEIRQRIRQEARR